MSLPWMVGISLSLLRARSLSTPLLLLPPSPSSCVLKESAAAELELRDLGDDLLLLPHNLLQQVLHAQHSHHLYMRRKKGVENKVPQWQKGNYMSQTVRRLEEATRERVGRGGEDCTHPKGDRELILEHANFGVHVRVCVRSVCVCVCSKIASTELTS